MEKSCKKRMRKLLYRRIFVKSALYFFNRHTFAHVVKTHHGPFFSNDRENFSGCRRNLFAFGPVPATFAGGAMIPISLKINQLHGF